MTEQAPGNPLPVTEADTARAMADEALAMGGLAWLRTMASGERPQAAMAETMGFRLVEVDEGRAVFLADPGEHHYNPQATVHGGLYATLIDSATGCAVHATLPPGVSYSTVTLQVDFLRPVTATGGPLRCEGRIVHRGSRIAIAEGEIVDEATGKVVGRGRTTCLLTHPEPRGDG